MGGSGGAAVGERVLVIHPGALGDLLQAVPALRALRGAPGVGAVALAAQPRLGRLLAGLGAVDAAVDFDGLGLEALFTVEGDASRAAGRLAGCGRVVSWFGARTDPYPDRLRGLVPRCLVAPPAPPAGSPVPVWEHLCASLRPWAPAPPPREPLPPPPSWRARAGAALASAGLDPARPPLVLHPGAGAAWKRWPAACFARAVERVVASPCPILVHEGPADAEATGELLALLGPRAARLSHPDLETLAGLLAACAAYLGGDSGVSQLAAAVGAPAIVVYPEATLAQWAPWSPGAQALPATAAGTEAAEAAARLAVLLRLT